CPCSRKSRRSAQMTSSLSEQTVGELGTTRHCCAPRRLIARSFEMRCTVGHPLDYLGIRACLALRQHPLINSIERSICSSVISLTPPECSIRKSRGHNNVNSLQ